MGEAKHTVELTAEVSGSPDAVFTYLTDHFFELWPGKGKVLEPGDDPAEPMGLGMVRLVNPPGSAALEERIVTHDRPSLIEYTVINEAPISNHLGRLELTPTTGGTKLVYTISFDYRPAAIGPVAAAVLRATWAARGRRRLRAAFAG
ncbi:MAG TPA: SRPBCC family protein [Solirubrobacterales bacterium]